MAFVVSRRDIGYFGYLSDQKLILFNSPFSKSSGLPIEGPFILPDSVDEGGSTNDPELEKHGDAEIPPAKKNNRPELNSAAISNCGNFISISDDNKQLHLWKRCDNKWSLLSTRTVPRKCLQLIFTNSGSDLIAADRGGDVYSFSVSEVNQCCKLILGHVCAILAVDLTEDDAYIVTCDRDAKIRVSCYPNTYNIESYCLGHREFVSALKVYSSTERLLLSGSGDGTIRLWKCDEGSELCCYDLRKDSSLHAKTQDLNSCSVDNHASRDLSAASEDPSGDSVIDNGELQFEKQVAVKCIRYCPETKVCALLFYMHSHVAIFQMNSTASGKSLQFVQCLNMECVPLDVYFDGAGYLWVLLPTKDNCVAIFKSTLCSDSMEFVKVEQTDSNKVREICLEIGNNWREFPVSIDVSNLYKPSYISGFGCDNQSPVKEKGFEPKWKKNKVN